MQAELERVEIEPVVLGDDDFAVEHAGRGQLRAECFDYLGEVAVERLFIAALDVDLVLVAEDQGAEPVPFGLEDPRAAGGDLVDACGEHREDWRIDGQVQVTWYDV